MGVVSYRFLLNDSVPYCVRHLWLWNQILRSLFRRSSICHRSASIQVILIATTRISRPRVVFPGDYRRSTSKALNLLASFHNPPIPAADAPASAHLSGLSCLHCSNSTADKWHGCSEVKVLRVSLVGSENDDELPVADLPLATLHKSYQRPLE